MADCLIHPQSQDLPAQQPPAQPAVDIAVGGHKRKDPAEDQLLQGAQRETEDPDLCDHHAGDDAVSEKRAIGPDHGAAEGEPNGACHHCHYPRPPPSLRPGAPGQACEHQHTQPAEKDGGGGLRRSTPVGETGYRKVDESGEEHAVVDHLLMQISECQRAIE